MRRILHFVLLLVLVLGLWPRPAARAAGNPAQRQVRITFEDMGYPTMKAVGAQTTVTYSLVIPAAWQRPGTLHLTLDISHSDLLLASRSVLTVVFNNLPLKTFPLDRGNQDHGLLSVEIPVTEPRPHDYTLDLIFYMRVSEEECKDLQSPALWAIVHNTSAVEFSLDEGEERLDLMFYPYPILPARTVVPSGVHFVLPPTPSLADLEAATRISAKLGQLGATDLIQITTGSWDQAPPGSNLIVIGTPATQPLISALQPNLPLPLNSDGMTFISPSGNLLAPDWGVIQTLEHPLAPDQSILIVSGGDERGLQRAGLALASQASIDLFKGRYAIIPEIQPGSDVLYHIPGQAGSRVSLVYLTGHEQDWTLKGMGLHNLSFSFVLPSHWKMGDSGYADLRIAHSPSLWAERSLLEVYLNGRLLHVELLNADNANPTTVRVHLPAKLLRPGQNLLSLRFTLALKMEQCIREVTEDVWAQLFTDSEIVLPHEESQPEPYHPELADYPYPFTGDPALEDTWLVLPDQPTPTEIAAALRIAARIGRAGFSKELRLHVTTASQLPADQRAGKHLLVISTGDRNGLMNEIAHRLRVAGQSLKSLSTYTGQPITTNWDTAPIGVIEAFASPWDETHALWVVFGTNDTALNLVADALSFGETATELGGDLAVLTTGPLEGGAVTLFTTLPTPTPMPEDQLAAAQAPKVPAPLTWFFGSLVVIVGALVLFVLYRERGRSQEK